MPYCAIINALSYLIAHTIGRFLHEENPDDEIDRLFIASTVAIVRFYNERFLILLSMHCIWHSLCVGQSKCNKSSNNGDANSLRRC